MIEWMIEDAAESFWPKLGCCFSGNWIANEKLRFDQKNPLPYLFNGLYVWSNRNDLFWDIVDLSLLFGVGGKKSEVHFSEGGLKLQDWLDLTPKFLFESPCEKKKTSRRIYLQTPKVGAFSRKLPFRKEIVHYNVHDTFM